MKTRRLVALAAAALGLAGLLFAGCSKKPAAAAPPAPAVGGAVRPAVPASSPVSPASWDTINDLTFEQRAGFNAGLANLLSDLDARIDSLKAKRATMTTDTKDWDFAMLGLTDARSYLRSMAGEVAAATPETWDQEKEKVHQAWLKAQDAYDKVRTSTTS